MAGGGGATAPPACKKRLCSPKWAAGRVPGVKGWIWSPWEGEHLAWVICPGAIDLNPGPSIRAVTCGRKPGENPFPLLSNTLERFTDAAFSREAEAEGRLSSPRSQGRLTPVIFSRRQA